MFRRILAVMLSAVLCLSVLTPAAVFAETGEEEQIFQVPEALKGANLGPKAVASASSVDAANYTIECMNDGVAGTGFGGSWCNDPSNSPMGSDCWAQLTWDAPITFNLISLYTVENYELGEYTIQYDQKGKWVDLLKVVNNSESRRDHAFDTKITTDKLRIKCLKGVYNSVDQMHFARITEIEVYDAVATTPAAILDYASSHLELGDLSAVTERITLPDNTLEETVSISWRSLTPDIVDAKGYVFRPDYGGGDAVGTLMATFHSAGKTLEKEYKVTVKQLPEDPILVKQILDQLSIENQDAVVTNLVLPAKDENGYTEITWKSETPEFITDDGKIMRDAENPVSAVLTATVHKRDTQESKQFNLNILPTLQPLETQTVETWRPAEFTFESDITYGTPYLDVQIDVVFEGPNGERMVMPGFWYEGNLWKVRFSPTCVGEWKFSVICTDTANRGLHGRNGTINCIPYEGSEPIYQHGFVHAEPGKRYLTYADGTPFFYISDCGWFALSYKTPLNSTNAPQLGSSAFKSWMDLRKKQGYNGFRTNFFIGLGGDVDSRGNRNEVGYPWMRGLLKTQESSGTGNDNGENAQHLWSISTFDGIDGTVWKASDAKYPQWIQVDYEAMKEISSARVLFAREDTWDFELQASNDGVNYTRIAGTEPGVGTVLNYRFEEEGEPAGQEQSGSFTGKEFKIVFDQSVNARYYRLLINGCASGKEASVGELCLYDKDGNVLNNSNYFRDMNPEYFKNTDQKIQYIANLGLVADLGLDWGRAIQPGSVEQYKQFARYMIARYGAYPTIWHTAGEAATGPIRPWIEVAKYTKEIDPYDRVNTIHNRVDNPDYGKYTEDLSWHDMTYSQSGHGRTEVIDTAYWEGLYNRTPVKPFIEGELIFENINGHPTKNTVESYWKVVMAGSMGFGYSAEGLWQSTIDYDQWHQVWGEKPIPWYVALCKEGGRRLPLMKKFMEDLSWWELAPDGKAIDWNNAPKGIPSPYQKSNLDRSVVVAYMPSCTARYNGTVNVRPGGVYTAKWYDTRTGEYTLISDQIEVGADGKYTMPAQPDNNLDWAFVISLNTKNTQLYQNVTFDRISQEQPYEVTQDLHLIQDSAITWESSNSQVIDASSGKVTPQTKDTQVLLIARIQTEAGVDEKQFPVTVKARTEDGGM